MRFWKIYYVWQVPVGHQYRLFLYSEKQVVGAPRFPIFFSFTYAELKERIMPKSYYRRCKNSSFVNGYNEMRIRKRQVHSWPFLTGKLIYWPAKRREHLHVWHTKETDHPGETQAEITRPSSTGSTEIKLHFSSLFLPYNNFLLNFYLITYV